MAAVQRRKCMRSPPTNKKASIRPVAALRLQIQRTPAKGKAKSRADFTAGWKKTYKGNGDPALLLSQLAGQRTRKSLSGTPQRFRVPQSSRTLYITNNAGGKGRISLSPKCPTLLHSWSLPALAVEEARNRRGNPPER